MNREQLVELCQQAPTIGAVRHEEFVDYISVLEQVRRVDGKWTKQEVAYMNVDGKIAMANEDHRRQQKQLRFEDPVILVDNDEQLTLMVSLESEVYGRRHGIATSRRVGGSSYEAVHPWEVAETSAIGRALSMMGYGVLPGSGLASADDVSRAQDAAQVAGMRSGALSGVARSRATQSGTPASARVSRSRPSSSRRLATSARRPSSRVISPRAATMSRGSVFSCPSASARFRSSASTGSVLAPAISRSRVRAAGAT